MQGDGLWTVYEVGDELPVLPVNAPTIEPIEAWKGKRTLLRTGKLSAVESAVANSQDVELQLAWAGATVWGRNDPMVMGMAQAMGWSDAEVDAMFEASR